MPSSESPTDPTTSDQPATATDDATRHDRAVEAMLASIERLNGLGLDGVEPASAFLWT
jgi:hypothetical protein